MKKVIYSLVAICLIISIIGFTTSFRIVKYSKVERLSDANRVEFKHDDVYQGESSIENIVEFEMSSKNRFFSELSDKTTSMSIDFYSDDELIDVVHIYEISTQMNEDFQTDLVYEMDEMKYVACIEYSYFGQKRIVVSLPSRIWVQLLNATR